MPHRGSRVRVRSAWVAEQIAEIIELHREYELMIKRFFFWTCVLLLIAFMVWSLWDMGVAAVEWYDTVQSCDDLIAGYCGDEPPAREGIRDLAERLRNGG